MPDAERRTLCGDLHELGKPITNRDILLAVADAPQITCRLDREQGTFCLDGVGIRGVLTLQIQDPQWSRRFSYELDIARYADPSRRLIIDLNELQPSIEVPEGASDSTRTTGQDPIQDVTK